MNLHPTGRPAGQSKPHRPRSAWNDDWDAENRRRNIWRYAMLVQMGKRLFEPTPNRKEN